MNRLCIKNFKNYIKVMEVPDKIYVGIDPIWGNMYVNYDKNDIDNIEYIRKDAFIEKVQDWVKNRAESFIVDTPLFPYFDYKKAIENLKEYMKGE